MPTTQTRNSNRVQEIGALSRGLQRLAKSLGVPIIALSQLSRSIEAREDHEPRLSDLRESGDIEQDADVILFPYRPECYAKTLEDKQRYAGRCRLFVAKQKDGPTGEIPLVWVSQIVRFESEARGY
jgi:replicative DNA helicase